mgnify:CR=1 FL=1
MKRRREEEEDLGVRKKGGEGREGRLGRKVGRGGGGGDTLIGQVFGEISSGLTCIGVIIYNQNNVSRHFLLCRSDK